MHADPTAAVSVPSNDFFLARQPILGRDQHLVAFELLFRAAGEDDDAKLTEPQGMTMAEFPVEPCVAKMVSGAHGLSSCFKEYTY